MGSRIAGWLLELKRFRGETGVSNVIVLESCAGPFFGQLKYQTKMCTIWVRQTWGDLLASIRCYALGEEGHLPPVPRPAEACLGPAFFSRETEARVHATEKAEGSRPSVFPVKIYL